MRVLAGLVCLLPFLLACMGNFSSQVVRVDYSHVDGGSCMSGGGRPSLAWKQDWDLSGCKSRSEGADDLSDACRAAFNAECCAQIGAEMVGWEVHQVGGEKLVSPLCKI